MAAAGSELVVYRRNTQWLCVAQRGSTRSERATSPTRMLKATSHTTHRAITLWCCVTPEVIWI